MGMGSPVQDMIQVPEESLYLLLNEGASSSGTSLAPLDPKVPSSSGDAASVEVFVLGSMGCKAPGSLRPDDLGYPKGKKLSVLWNIDAIRGIALSILYKLTKDFDCTFQSSLSPKFCGSALFLTIPDLGLVRGK